MIRRIPAKVSHVKTIMPATVAGMIVFTWLTLAGMRRINLGLLEKYELGLMGVLLCAVGVLIIFFEK